LFFTVPSTTPISPLSLHDALPILRTTILIYAAFNLVAALISYPAGSLSDRWGRRNVLLASFLIFVASYLGFALTRNVAVVAVLRSEEHTSELQSLAYLVCRLLLEK